MAQTPAGVSPAGFEAAQAVADAVLYEGYLLYPYRRSSGKNRIRWQFGILLPPVWARKRGLTDESVAGSAESWWQQTECLLEAPADATIHLRLRFLQLQHKSVQQLVHGGEYRPVDSIDTGSQAELTVDEAVPRELDAEVGTRELLTGERQLRFEVPGGEETELLTGNTGHPLGRIVRRRWPVAASVTLSLAACDAPYPLLRLRARTENAEGDVGADAERPTALRRSLIACHTLLAVRGGIFVSLLEPPQWAAQAARACRNVHTFPVLAGAAGGRNMVLSAPILLYDYPQVAPESPGDLHDAAEIDEILSLRTLTLTQAEKREARATDPRAAAIIDRVETMPAEVLSRLHGAVRSLRPAQDPQRPDVPWWDPGADSSVSPETDAVVVAGTPVARGSRVLLRPRTTGTDPQDMFLDGRIARVEAVLLDVDDSHHLAVTLEDDPGADLNQWYGRFRYFSPDEVEPLPAGKAGPPGEARPRGDGEPR